MPRSNVITDRQRADIYENFISQRDRTSSLNREENEEIQKTKTFFTTALNTPTESPRHYEAEGYAIPVGHAFSTPPIFATAAAPAPTVIHHHHNSGIPWWAFCLMNRNGGTINNYYGTAPTRGEENGSNRQNSNFAAYAGVLIIACVVTAPAVIGAFYLMSELWNNLERLYYNEGYLQAGLGMANIVMSLSLSTVLTNAVLSSAITALAVSAGFANPVGWAFFIMFCVTFFAAAFIHFAVQEGIYRMTTYNNQDALHPEEPGRFTVTNEQVADILRNDKRGMRGLDGDKMQNVITAIHHDMMDDPSRMTRIFRFSPLFRDTHTAERLKAIRTLRMTGKVDYTTEATCPNTDGEETTSLRFNSQSLRT